MKCPKCGSQMVEIRIWDNDGFCTIIWICDNCSYTEKLSDIVVE